MKYFRYMDRQSAVRRTLLLALGATTGQGTVVSLSGAWGSGKTHMWQEVAAELRKRSLRTAYVSLFGLTSIAEVKTAIVNAAWLGTAGEEAKAKQLARWFTTQLPGLFQMFDKRLGFELISRTLELTTLLPEGTVVCLDDLERISDALKVEDVLGLAGFLSDTRKARVLLILNDAHLEEKHKGYATLLRAYRERVVKQALRLDANIEDILPKLQAASGLAEPLKHRVRDAMLRARCSNVRTLMRALDQVALLIDTLQNEPRTSQIDFLSALIIEDAEGNLKAYGAYEFLPVRFAFERVDPVSETAAPDGWRAYQRSFYFRHFGADAEYVSSKAVFEFVTKGYPDADLFMKEVKVEAATGSTDLQRALHLWQGSRFWCLSDDELHSWRAGLLQATQAVEPLSAAQWFEWYAAICCASEMLEVEIPAEARSVLLERVQSCGSAVDESAQDLQHHLGRFVSPDLLDAYLVALGEGRFRQVREAIEDAIAKRSLEAFREHVENNVPESLRVALASPAIESLEAARSSNRRFFFDAIDVLVHCCVRSAESDQAELLKMRLESLAAADNVDKSDRWRVRSILSNPDGKRLARSDAESL